jgi:2-methylisocitrate lyase-like PEP mutase family enzyme
MVGAVPDTHRADALHEAGADGVPPPAAEAGLSEKFTNGVSVIPTIGPTC